MYSDYHNVKIKTFRLNYEYLERKNEMSTDTEPQNMF